MTIQLPPYREQYKLSEDNKLVIARLREELQSRLKVDVSFDVYKENALIRPRPLIDHIMVEIRVGNYRCMNTISEVELDNVGGGSFFYLPDASPINSWMI